MITSLGFVSVALSDILYSRIEPGDTTTALLLWTDDFFVPGSPDVLAAIHAESLSVVVPDEGPASYHRHTHARHQLR